MSKQNSKERFEQIYKSFEPLREAKRETIHYLGRLGRKHPILKYPVFLFLTAFIFIYNVFLYLFIYVHETEGEIIKVLISGNGGSSCIHKRELCNICKS